MSIVGSLRKGFRFFLMSMGVSTYPRRALSRDNLGGQQNLGPMDAKPVTPAAIPPTLPK